MQGEIYTEEDFGSTGELTESYAKLLDERPEYFVFNGAVHGLKTEAPLKAKVGEMGRIFFGVGGPNKASAFHAIGEIFDSVYSSVLDRSCDARRADRDDRPGGSHRGRDDLLAGPIAPQRFSRLERGRRNSWRRSAASASSLRVAILAMLRNLPGGLPSNSALDVLSRKLLSHAAYSADR